MEKNKATSWFLPIILGVVTVSATALLMFSDAITAEKIEQQKMKKTMQALALLIPDELHDNQLLDSRIEIFLPQQLGHRKATVAYIGRMAGKLSVMALPVVAQNGYSGDIELMVGIKSNGEITAVNVISHRETPGLGDLIEANKSDWLKQFPDTYWNSAKDKNWRVKKDGGDFDQITGATITPRAVVQAIKKALLYFQEHKSEYEVAHE